MDHFQHVIIGGGMVAGYAAKEFAKQGVPPGAVAIIAGEATLPYQRPFLSKEYLTGEKELAEVSVNKPGFYEESGLTVLTDCRATGLDLATRQVQTATGQTLAYDNLLLATGSRLRTLDLPGSDQAGIYYLRTLAQCEAIKHAAASAQSVVVVGAGFIGCEVAAHLAAMNLEVTLLYRESHLLDFVFTPEMSAYYEDLFLRQGIRLLSDIQVAGFAGDGSFTGVELAGAQTVTGDFAVVGVGVSPDTDLAATAGLAVDNGVVVNEYLETATPGVYAAGDVACYFDVVYGKQKHIEHEMNAIRQGRHAAKAMLGDRQVYSRLPEFYSRVFDISWTFYGETRDADAIVHRGDVSVGDFSTWWLREGKLLGAFVMDNRPEAEGKLAQEWIKSGEAIDPKVLTDAQEL
jgi:3-phenylpropionate/trans-cinnamate dioxygenase ferredoxin reductase component